MQATKRVKNPRKQRKIVHSAPAHVRHKLMAAPLSRELATSKGARTLPVRKGDTIRIMRGDHSGFEGKVSRIDLKRYRVFVEGLTREKVDGTNIFVAVHPSKVMIRSLNLDDKWRKAIVDRKHKLEPPQKGETAVPKTEKKALEPKGEAPVEKARAVAKTAKTHREKKTTEKPRTIQRKPASSKKAKVSTAGEKPTAGKRLAKATAKKEETADLKTKSETPPKKTPRKLKTTASKKDGEI